MFDFRNNVVKNYIKTKKEVGLKVQPQNNRETIGSLKVKIFDAVVN